MMERNLKTYASAVALLGSLGMLPAGEAAAVAIPPSDCPGQSPPGSGRTSVVLSEVVPGTPDTQYGFRVCNTSAFPGERQPLFLIRDWELPYDPLAKILNIVTPEGWNYTIETIGSPRFETGWEGTASWLNPSDPFFDPRYANLDQVIHFYTCEGSGECYGNSSNGNSGSRIFPGGNLAGFGFQSPYSETNAPYQASWTDFLPRSGDPAFPTPGGPNSPGLLVIDAAVPEPGGLALFTLALGALMAGRGRRRKPESA